MFKKNWILLISFLLSLVCKEAYASNDYSENSTYIDSMETKIIAKENYRSHVQQKITAHLNDNHGIFVNVTFQPGTNTIKNINVKGPGNYEVYNNSDDINTSNTGIKTIKIGNEDKEYTGNKTWVVSYVIHGFQTSKDKQNNLSLSLVPAYWELPIKKVKTTVIMPKPIDWDKMRMISGHPDEQPTLLQQNSLFKITKTAKTLTIEGEKLPAKYGASMGGKLPKHYWKNPILLSHFSYTLSGIGIFLILIALFCLFKFGRENKPVVTIEFYPPDKMDPVKMGYFIDGRVDNKDIIAMLFYFASEDFITIKETSKKYSLRKHFKFIKKSKKIGFTNYQRTLLKGLFSKGDTFETNKINNDFVSCLNTVKEQVKTSIPQLYDKRSLVIKNILLCVGIFLEVLALLITRSILGYNLDFLLFGILGISSYLIYRFSYCLHRKNSIDGSSSLWDKFKFIFVVFIYLWTFNIFFARVFINRFSGIICSLLFISYFVIVQFTKKRSDKWLELDGKVLGFKKFIETAELSQLNALVEENPEYFYKILPYAYIFGLTDKWAKHFEYIPSYQPSWYDGEPLSYDDWNATFCSTINDTQHQIQINESKEWITNSDSSSSSGGNSSGGGFGGGGGGVW